MRGRTPGQLIIQTTDFCNATCPQCGMRKQEKFERTRLKTEEMKRIIDRASKNRVKALSFTGGGAVHVSEGSYGVHNVRT